jgi:hypothetical protein
MVARIELVSYWVWSTTKSPRRNGEITNAGSPVPARTRHGAALAALARGECVILLAAELAVGDHDHGVLGTAAAWIACSNSTRWLQPVVALA